jgi:hypothetical protein
MYLLALKILGPIAFVLGLWWGYAHFVEKADKTGYNRALAEWKEADRVADAIEAETKRLLTQARDRNQDILHARLKTASSIATRNDSTVIGLRLQLDELAAASATDPSSSSTCGGDDERIRRVLPILAEGPGLVEEARAAFERCAAKLTSLQEYTLTIAPLGDGPRRGPSP